MNGWPSEASQQAPQPQQPQVTIEQRNAKIRAWLASKITLQTAKDGELNLRTSVTQMLFPNPIKGTQRYELGDGYKVKLVYGYNYNLGNKDKLNDKNEKVPVNEQVESVMDAIEALGNEGAFLADRLIKTKYELSVSEYQKLDETNPTHKAIKALIDGILTVTPATPTLEFEEPK